MRAISLDTETTGFSAADDRIVDIGCVEVFNDFPTGKTFQAYINPLMAMPAAAFDVHGLSDEFLKDKPTFDQIVDDFLDFVGDSMLIIHNAAFDLRFLNAELERCGKKPLPNPVRDTLQTAKKKLPIGSILTLDSLCKKFKIDNSGRSVHGALLDASLLVDVNIALEGKNELNLVSEGTSVAADRTVADVFRKPRNRRPAFKGSDAEREAFEKFVESISVHLKKSNKDESPLWLSLNR